MSEDLGNPEIQWHEVSAEPEQVQEEALGLSNVVEGVGVRYTVVTAEQANQLDYSSLLTTSFETARKSEDGTKVIVKFSGQVPSAISELNTTLYTLQEISELLLGEDWVPEITEL